MLVTTPALFWNPLDRIPEETEQSKMNTDKYIKIDALVTNWTGISPTYPIHNRTLLCVSPWVDYQFKSFPSVSPTSL